LLSLKGVDRMVYFDIFEVNTVFLFCVTLIEKFFLLFLEEFELCV